MTHVPLPDGLRIRKITSRKDYRPMADLIEDSFREFLDPDGRAFIEELRRSGAPEKFGLADAFLELIFGSPTFLIEGYVCLNEKNRIIGTVHLLPINPPEGSSYLIVNVCVLKEYRKQGIANALLRSALRYAENRSASAIYLQVRDGNPDVVHLYEKLGFETVTVRRTWVKTGLSAEDLGTARRERTIVESPGESERDDFNRAFRIAYPPELRWEMGYDAHLFEFSRWARICQWLKRDERRFYSVRDEDGRIGWIAFQPTQYYAQKIWLVPENGSIKAWRELLKAAVGKFRGGKPLSLNLAPELTDDARESALHELGFKPDLPLILMRRTGTT